MKISPKVRPLFFWSQKVLPLVYDDSLSYYEVLNKVVAKLNELIHFVGNTLKDEIAQLISEYFVELSYNSETETIYLSIEEDNNE